MVRILFKQPNGKYCVYSTVSDQIIAYNMTQEEYIKDRCDELKAQLLTMFEVQDVPEGEHWKGTPFAEIQNSDYLITKIFPYNWSKEELKVEVGILKDCGYKQEDINKIIDKYNQSKKEE